MPENVSDFSALARKRVLFLDGAMGTQLQMKGLQPGEAPETWNISRPDDVKAVHDAYLAAGADIVYANTFGANRAKYRSGAPLQNMIESRAKVLAGVACN